MEEQQQAQLAAGLVAPQPDMMQPQMDLMNNFLPAALLAQYPALQNIDWNNVPQGPPPDEDAYNGHGSYDASSGGEFYEDVSENEMGNYQDSAMSGMGDLTLGHEPRLPPPSPGRKIESDRPPVSTEFAYGRSQAGDYLSDFEGR